MGMSIEMLGDNEQSVFVKLCCIITTSPVVRRKPNIVLSPVVLRVARYDRRPENSPFVWIFSSQRCCVESSVIDETTITSATYFLSMFFRIPDTRISLSSVYPIPHPRVLLKSPWCEACFPSRASILLLCFLHRDNSSFSNCLGSLYLKEKLFLHDS